MLGFDGYIFIELGAAIFPIVGNYVPFSKIFVLVSQIRLLEGGKIGHEKA